MSPKNKKTNGLKRIQGPVAGSVLMAMLGQPVLLLAQVPTPVPPPPAANAGATAAAPEVVQPAPILPTAPTSVFRPKPPALPAALANPASRPAAVADGKPVEAKAGEVPETQQIGLNGPSTLTTDLPAGSETKLVQMKYKDTPLDLILENVSEWTGRMLIKAPGINASITLMSNDKIAVPEALQAIETVLAMNNVGLVKMGTKFLKVVPIANVQPEGLKINFGSVDKGYPDADQMVNQVVQLKYMDPAEAQPILQPLLHGYGKIQVFERTNSLLISDTGANVNRILDVLAYIDQPAESKSEMRIYPINYAKAADIASRINELIADTQGKEEKPRVASDANGAVSVSVIPTPPGIIRAPRPIGSSPGSVSASGESAADAAERGVVRGKVKIVSDERMNLLFVISRVENFAFFDKIITVLDRPTDPEVSLRVMSLKFAKSDEMASLLNEFIGAAKDDTKSATSPGASSVGGLAANDARSVALRDYAASRQTANNTTAAAKARLATVNENDPNSIGRLSPTTRILAYKPTNSILLMGRRSDLDALNKLIDKLDVMLAQVLIETVILEVNLGSDLSYGVDWLQRSMTAYRTTQPGPGGGLTVGQPVASFGGGTAFGGGGFRDGAAVDRATPLGSGLTYYTTLFDLNLDAVIKMAKSSRDARVLQTPVVLTTDNKEAKIKVGESRPIVNANIVQTTGQNTQNYEYKDIGIELTVTPRINPNGVVEMEIKQTADNVGGTVNVSGSEVPIITRREMSADVSVRHNQTIILGGLTSTDKSKSRTGVPILMDIPILGALFRSDGVTDSRTELLVLITPYVLKSPEEAREETARLHAGSASSKTKWHEGWSDSELPRMTEQEMQDLVARRKSRLLQLDREEATNGATRVSTSMFEEPIQKDKKASGAETTEPVPTTNPTPIPEVLPTPPSTTSPVQELPSEKAPAIAPANIDPSAVVPSGK